jgi:hypothetical protein
MPYISATLHSRMEGHPLSATVERLREKITARIHEAEVRGDAKRAEDWRRGLAEIERCLPATA